MLSARRPTHMARGKLLRRLGRGLLRLAIWGASLAALAVVGLWGYFRYDFARAAEELPYLEERARALGIPLTPDEMRQKPAVSPTENAAPLYARAAAEFDRQRLDSVTDGLFRSAVDDPSGVRLGPAALAITRFEAALDLAAAAAMKPRADFAISWEEGPFAELGPFATLKDSAKHLVYRGLIRIRTGEVDRGLDDLRSASRVAHHASADPTLIGLLVHIAIEAIALNGYQHAATFLSHDAAALERIRRDLAAIPPLPEFETVMKAEAFLDYYFAKEFFRFFDRIRREWADEYGWDHFGEFPAFVYLPPLIDPELVSRAYAARCLEHWVNSLESLPEGSRGRSELSARLQASVSRVENELRPSGLLSRVMSPVFWSAGSVYDKALATRASVGGLVAVLRFRVKTGRLPKTLAEAGFEERDPFDGGPMRFLRTENGFRVYSVGENGRDDSGLSQIEARQMADGDEFRDRQHLRMQWDLPAIYPVWDKRLQ